MTAFQYPVLHIDDDPAVTRMVTLLLRSRGIEAAELNDPERALDILMTHDYRVVLLDIDMPGLNGLDLLSRIKHRDGGVNVIMLTGLVSQTSVLASMRRGAMACLFKPIDDPQTLIDAITIAFENTNRWWDTLGHLSALRRQGAPQRQPIR